MHSRFPQTRNNLQSDCFGRMRPSPHSRNGRIYSGEKFMTFCKTHVAELARNPHPLPVPKVQDPMPRNNP